MLLALLYATGADQALLVATLASLPLNFPTSSFLWVLVARGAMDLSSQRYLQTDPFSSSHFVNLYTDGDKCGLLYIRH